MSDTDGRDEMEATAAEYVLGTLRAEERATAESWLRSNDAFRAAVAEWEQRLQPLADTAPAVAPPADFFHRIAAEIGGGEPVSGVTGVSGGARAGDEAQTMATLTQAVSRWRLATACAVTIAIAAVVVTIGDHMFASDNNHQYVAVLAPGGITPAFVATLSLASNTIVVRQLADAPPPDRSYQLWAIPMGQMPQSLGVIQQAQSSHDLGELDPGNLTLAVSLEPKGGSTTGAPTGPVVFTGTLIPGN